MSTSLVSPYGKRTFQAASTSLHGQFTFAKLTTDGKIDDPGAGDLCVVLEEGVASGGAYVTGNYYTCVFEGIVKVLAAASLNAGVAVTTDTNGAAVAATSGNAINGVTVAACASGDLVPVRVSLSGAKV